MPGLDLRYGGFKGVVSEQTWKDTGTKQDWYVATFQEPYMPLGSLYLDLSS